MDNLEQALKQEKMKTKRNSFWDAVFKKKSLKKPQRIAVLYLRKNNAGEVMDVDTNKGFFDIAGKTYHVSRDCLYTLGKERIPLAIIEEDGLIPKGNADFYARLNDINALDKMNARYQNLVLQAIRHAELVKYQTQEKGKINPKVAIGLAIGAIIAYALFRNYF